MIKNQTGHLVKTNPNKANPPKVYLPVAGGQVSDNRSLPAISVAGRSTFLVDY